MIFSLEMYSQSMSIKQKSQIRHFSDFHLRKLLEDILHKKKGVNQYRIRYWVENRNRNSGKKLKYLRVS